MRFPRAMATAPHALASQSALSVLSEGGNAVEAMIAAAATIAVAYPHMNSIGGDSFWLISPARDAPVGIEACGAAAAAASLDSYRERGLKSIPFRGPLAANTVAGTVSGWSLAQHWSAQRLGGRLPMARLLEDAIRYAREGVPLTRSHAETVAEKWAELEPVAGFAAHFAAGGQLPREGQLLRQPRLATTLERLAQAGLEDFYRGELAHNIAAELQRIGSPLALEDLQRHQARFRTPLALAHSQGTLYNMPPPTQGLVCLLILGQLDRLLRGSLDPLGPQYVHACVEATKSAFVVRDRHVTDPDYMDTEAAQLLESCVLDEMAGHINMQRAAAWGGGTAAADTVWLGAIDCAGVAVSFIQSIYHEFGSAVVLSDSGITWHNRGCSFSLDPAARNPLTPLRRPYHTLSPALARLGDGRTLVYGSMGGDGQPQFQSAVFTRIARFGYSAQAAIDAPRWLLGRGWGHPSETLKLEARFPQDTFDALEELGHDVERVGAYDGIVGHAGVIIRYPDGTLEGGSDPRSDGAALGC